jgi:hypothetical protein
MRYEVGRRRRSENQRPRRRCSGPCLLLVETRSLIIRCLALAEPAESVVHADQDSGRGRFGVEATAEVTATRTEVGRKYGPIAVAEVVVITFKKRRPLWREPPFKARTNRPACSGLGGAAKVTVNAT